MNNIIKERSERRAEAIKRVTANKDSARLFLQKAGIITKAGDLKKIYR
jgi:hypothetical protein